MPNLSVTEGQIPAVSLNAEFTYFGRRFSFDLKNESAKAALEEKLLNLLETTNKLKMNSNKAENPVAVYSLSKTL